MNATNPYPTYPPMLEPGVAAEYETGHPSGGPPITIKKIQNLRLLYAGAPTVDNPARPHPASPAADPNLWTVRPDSAALSVDNPAPPKPA